MEANGQISEATLKSLKIILADYATVVGNTDHRLDLHEITEAQGQALMWELAEQRRDPEFAEYFDEIQIWDQGGADERKFRFLSLYNDSAEFYARFIWDGEKWDRLCV